MRNLAILFLAAASRLSAQQTPSSDRPQVSAYRHEVAPEARAAPLRGSVSIDGRLDEEAWVAATPVTNLIQDQPVEGAQPTERTEIRVLIGSDALYIGASMLESNPANIRPRLARRDEPVDGDVFAVAIDSRHDHLSAYYFRVTAGGAVRDAVGTSGGDGLNLDLSWDAVWEARVSNDARGWYAEIRIPLSQLPYNRTPDPVWGIQFERYGWNKQERNLFAFTPRTENTGVQRFGHLTGLGELPAPSRIELLPYVSARAEYLEVDPNSPFRDESEMFQSVGADLKYRVTSNLTLNATVNPDFGQVEVDPRVINLSAFETFFPEKRPFFVEGQNIFRFGTIRTFNSFGAPSLFFSRRIGRQPQRSLGGAFRYANAPEQSTIAGAAKLTGRTSGGWSLGALEAVTLREEADYLDASDVKRTAVVEPLTNYFVGRLRREMRGGNTVVGGLVTAVNRDLGDPALESALRSAAYVGGVDFNHAWNNRRWALDGSIAATSVSGSESAIAATQLSSARFYQRPDSRELDFDPARTSLGGYFGQAALTKLSGVHWIGNVAYQETSPGFESNDVGFQTSADRRALSSLVGYQETKPGKILRNYNISAFTNQTWNRDGDIVFNNYAASAFAQFANFSFINLRSDYSAAGFDDRLTRGGPVTRQPPAISAAFFYGTDQRKTYTAQFEFEYTRSDEGRESTNYSVSFTLQPSPTFNISLAPFLGFNRDPAQFLDSIPDPSFAPTFGTRYIFSPLDQTTLAIVTRVNWTFSQTLSFQLFAQPLVSAGDFGSLTHLRAPRSYDFDVDAADFGNLDFNIRSLRGNAVLRWEYRPGSTLFFVWQQRRNGFQPDGVFDFGPDYSDIFREKPENVFAVKATYWIAR